ncbi:MAG TPA: transketolase C-terminal domain-containing protein, partial [candidate division Zixibacteria bacterium]|nr:transketolase C-terminal domain-containing protein [candidate division Zixibacteria bacterium]
RAGLVGADGPTHHGCFDISYLQTVPNMTVTAPKDGAELRALMRHAVEEPHRGPISIRYPRASVPSEPGEDFAPLEWGAWETLREGERVAVLAVGTMVQNALIAADKVSRETGDEVTVINCRFIKPLDLAVLEEVAGHYDAVITVEENALLGGFGSTVARVLNELSFDGRVISLGIPDEFVTHGTIAGLWRELGLDADAIARRISEALGARKNGRKSLLSRLTFRKGPHKTDAPAPLAAEALAPTGSDDTTR